MGSFDQSLIDPVAVRAILHNPGATKRHPNGKPKRFALSDHGSFLDDRERTTCDTHFHWSAQVGRVLARLDPALFDALAPALPWVDWCGHTSHFPYDRHVNDSLVLHLVAGGHLGKVAQVVERLPLECPDEAAASIAHTNYELHTTH